MTITPARVGRVFLLVLLARWTWVFLAWPMREDTIGSSFLHTVSLPFHEAGHVIFSPFGDFMTTFGGSLTQELVPIVCGIAFVTTSPNVFGAAVMGWWAGENLMDVAVYINDARSLSLTLLGGHTGAEVEGHDWEHILQSTNLIVHDHQIAWTVHAIGGAVMIGALVVAAVLAARTPAEERA
jgi:hypothetical protein